MHGRESTPWSAAPVREALVARDCLAAPLDTAEAVAAVGLLEIRGYNVLLSYHQIAHSWWMGFALPTKNSSRRVSCGRLARCCNFG